jgi:uncharacterized protein YfaP (DUF2135 family)
MYLSVLTATGDHAFWGMTPLGNTQFAEEVQPLE